MRLYRFWTLRGERCPNGCWQLTFGARTGINCVRPADFQLEQRVELPPDGGVTSLSFTGRPGSIDPDPLKGLAVDFAAFELRRG